jgi:mannose-6-phosphate isomerase-like protein (cupin superfamily)
MSSRKIDRRSMLAYSAASGAALTGGLGMMLGGWGEIVLAAQGTPPALPMPAGRMRRVVTGHNADGKSYIVSDEMADLGNLWTTKPDQPLGVPPAGEARQLSHATGETRFFMTTIQPSKDPKPTLANRLGFHRTPGIAYCFMLTGEIVFLVDTQEVTVRAGDLVVERNTLHSWRNEGTVPVAMLITVVNASA